MKALFYVTEVLDRKSADGSVMSQIVRMSAAYAPNSEHPNYEFWKATPTGSHEMQINAAAAFDWFKLGKQYLLEFTPVE